MPQPATHPLVGTLIGVTAARRAPEQISLLGRLGASVLHAPSHTNAADLSDGTLSAALTGLLSRPPEVIVASTAIGLSRWVLEADASGQGAALRALLAGKSLFVRGPQAAGCALGLGFTVRGTPSLRLDDVVAQIAALHPSGTRVAVQLDGSYGLAAATALRALGMEVVEIPVYRYTYLARSHAMAKLVRAVAACRLDAVTFTNSGGVRTVAEAAEGLGLGAEVRSAFAGAVVAACVGPVCASTARDVGYRAVLQPTRPGLGMMVHTVAEGLSQPLTLRSAAGTIAVRRTAVVVDGHSVELSERERAVLGVLVDQPGTVFSKAEIAASAWPHASVGDHTVEVLIGRLRQRLGSAGTSIKTVPRRGYRIAPDG